MQFQSVYRDTLRWLISVSFDGQRSDFEALVQACERLGVDLEPRTGHKAVQYVKIRTVAPPR